MIDHRHTVQSQNSRVHNLMLHCSGALFDETPQVACNVIPGALLQVFAQPLPLAARR